LVCARLSIELTQPKKSSIWLVVYFTRSVGPELGHQLVRGLSFIDVDKLDIVLTS